MSINKCTACFFSVVLYCELNSNRFECWREGNKVYRLDSEMMVRFGNQCITIDEYLETRIFQNKNNLSLFNIQL